ncbi:MAG: HD domain-containing protein [Thermomicrobiales bacterium]
MIADGAHQRSGTGQLNTSPVLQLATIAEVGAAITSERTCEAVLRVLFNEARWLVNFARCALVLTTDSGLLRILTQVAASAPAQERMLPRAAIGPAAQVLADRQPLRLDDLQDTWPEGEPESPLFGKASRSALVLPLIVEGRLFGLLVFAAHRAHAYPPAILGLAQLLTLHVASAIRTSLLLEELDGHENVILSLALTLEAKDQYTEGHSARVTEYALLLGRDLDLPERELTQLRMAAMLHDVGKIAIPEAILGKASPLTDDEVRLFRTHPLVGERICLPLRSARAVLPAIRHHHERWDGRGYPDGLCGDETPIAARIIAVADAYDAMTSDRPYRLGMPPERALAILRANIGPQWDPELVERFIPLIEQLLSTRHALRPISLADLRRPALQVASGG